MQAPKAPLKLSSLMKPKKPTVQNMIGEMNNKITQVKWKTEEDKKIASGLLKWMIGTVDQSFKEWRTSSLADFIATTQTKPEITQEEIKEKFPEFRWQEQSLADFIATIEAKPEITQEEVQQKFPEFYTVEKQKIGKQKKWVFSVASDILGWAYRSVSDLPQTIVETWILDKPAESVAKWPIWEAIRSGVKSLVWEKALADYQAKEWNKSFSEVAKGMTAWDPTSSIYQWTRTLGDVLQIGTAWIQIAKWVAKQWLKKSLLWMIKESDTVGNKRAALSRWWIETQGKLSKWWVWSKDTVKPSQRTLDAVEEIVNTVKWASKNPQKLFTQVSRKISSLWSNLEDNLKVIWIKWAKMSKKNLRVKLADLSAEIKDISPSMWNKLKILSKDITKAENADDFRKALQRLDDLVPDSVRKWINLSWKDQYIYNARRAARSEGNDFLEKITDVIPDVEVKKAFKSMSNLYHAKWQIRNNIWRLTPKVIWMKTKIARFVKNAALIWWGWYIAGRVWSKAMWWGNYQD